jgi:uncharacterized protein (DUF1684 family)
MQTKYFTYLFLVLALSVVFFSLYDMSDDYTKSLLKERKQKDKEFASASSPLSDDKIKNFKGLKYYPPDVSYRIEAQFFPNRTDSLILIYTSTDKTRKYRVLGKAVFSLSSQAAELEVYTSQDMDGHIFIPFTDSTTGIETYGGGRYLDASAPKADKIVLDFNRAYSPYCAYSDGYDCPKPPLANHLKAAVRAGEKILE